MKSETLHKFLMLSTMLLLLLFDCVPIQSKSLPLPEDGFIQRPVLFIQTNNNVENANNYQITIEKNPQPGQPCLTISWKNNPDGSVPPDPKIYMGNGYFKILPNPVVQT